VCPVDDDELVYMNAMLVLRAIVRAFLDSCRGGLTQSGNPIRRPHTARLEKMLERTVRWMMMIMIMIMMMMMMTMPQVASGAFKSR
jgi:hypothetical protein